MTQIREPDDATNDVPALEKHSSLIETIGDPAFVDRLRAITSAEYRNETEALRALLQFGADRLAVEHGHLTHIDPADGTHVVEVVSTSHPTVEVGVSRDLSTTYCRMVIANNATLSVGNAPEEGWDDDPAYDAFGFSTYLGSKVVVDGALYGTLCFVDRTPTDVTEEQQAAVELLTHAANVLLRQHRTEQEALPAFSHLRVLFEHSPNMINIHDAEGNLIAPNPRLCEKTGYTEEELKGMKVWELDQEVAPDTAKTYWQQMEWGDRDRWEGTFRCKDGTTFPVEVDLQCIRVAGDARFMVTSRDITPRKEAEEALKQSEELHRETLRNITDTVVLAEDDGTLFYVCPNVDHIFGIDQEEAETRGTVSTLFGGDPFEGCSFDECGEVTNVEWRITDPDGEVRDLLINIRQVSIQDGSRMYTCRDVTERKKRERQLEAVFNQTYQFTGLLEPDGTLLRANDTALQFGGMDADDVLGKPVWETKWFQTGADTKERLRDAVQRAAEGEFVRHEIEVQGTDGLRIVDFSLRPVKNEHGEITLLIPEGRDITERKTAERRLREERDFLDRILDTSPAGIVVLSPEGEFVEASDQAEAVLGLERDAVTGRTYNDPEWHIRGPDGGPIPDADLPFSRVIDTEEPVYDIEHMIEWPDGTQRLLSVSGAPLYSDQGTLEGGVFHLDDITERRAAQQALREERDRFATLFHNLPTPVVYGRFDEEGALGIQSVNPRFETVFGTAEEEVQGETLQHLIVPPDDREAARAMWTRLLQGEPVSREVRRQAADGRRDFQVQLARREREGSSTDGFAIYTDVTERKNRERRLARRRALLEAQAEATIDGLLAVDDEQQVAFYNDKFLDLWNLSAETVEADRSGAALEHVLVEPASDLLPDPSRFRQKVRYLSDHPREESRDLIPLTDGRWLDRYSAPILGDDDTYFGRLWGFRDVTAHRRMLERLLEVQDEERRRIDQEIHDEMGGLLTSLQFTIDLARRTAQEEGASTDHFDELEELVSELSTVSRTISRRLYPSDLADNGLAEAFPHLISELERTQDLNVDLYNEIEPGDRFSDLLERTIYWIVQEALLNVARHADADTTQVIVNKVDKRLMLHVFDEGAGIDQSGRDDENGFRLDAVRHRVNWLDGDVRTDPIPDEGTRISVALPTDLPSPLQNA